MPPKYILSAAAAVLLSLTPARAQTPGHSDHSFSQPSRAPGVDYTLPSEDEIKTALDRIRGYFVASTRIALSTRPPASQSQI